jgi:hypothetical protein
MERGAFFVVTIFGQAKIVTGSQDAEIKAKS